MTMYGFNRFMKGALISIKSPLKFRTKNIVFVQIEHVILDGLKEKKNNWKKEKKRFKKIFKIEYGNTRRLNLKKRQ